MSKKQTEIFSIFGQIEAAAAAVMIMKKKAKRIELKDFPRGAPMWNENGVPARFAVIIPAKYRREFNKLCEDLRA